MFSAAGIAAAKETIQYSTERVRLWQRRLVARTQLRKVVEKGSIRKAEIVLVSVMRNDGARLRYWLNFYKTLGVDHFLIVDNGSADGTMAHLEALESVTVYRTLGSYKNSHYGVDWVNALLWTRRVRKWVIYVDTDEFLIFDGSASKTLKDLTALLEAEKIESLQCLLLDMYSGGEVQDNAVAEGGDPFEVCNLFDAAGYVEAYDPKTQTTWVKGGVRGRLFFASDVQQSPALNKTPLVKVTRRTRFVQSTHRLIPRSLNSQSSAKQIAGVLLHQKFLASVSEKVADSAHVAQHDSEYSQYVSFGTATPFRNDLSRTYRTGNDLLEAQLMSPLGWPDECTG